MMLNFDVEENRRGLTEQDSRRYCGFVTPAQVSFLLAGALACWGISGLFAAGVDADSTHISEVSSKIDAEAGAHTTQLVGGAKDDHGCLSAAGYSYCPTSNAQDGCIRPWIESCPGGTQFCQEYCQKMESDQEVGTMQVTCACGEGGKALDYNPPQCTDLAPYRLGDMLHKCPDSKEAYAVIGGQCERLDGCSKRLNAFETQSECESKCLEGAL
jgi:hypothetical protein